MHVHTFKGKQFNLIINVKEMLAFKQEKHQN